MKALYPGALVCALIGIAAMGLSAQYNMPVMILAILLGLALNFLSSNDNLTPGIDWSAKTLLYAGVALLGLRIDASVIIESGWLFPLFALGLLIVTLLTGFIFGRAFKLDKSFSVLLASAVAICGVSAAAAIACVLPKTEKRDAQLAITIAGITVLSTLAILLYPAIAKLLAMNNTEGGLFLGGTIHNVSQAVGAGYAVSEETGNIATIVKLIRVAALLPVILCITFIYARSGKTDVGLKTYFPPFLIIFFILAVANYFGLLSAHLSTIGSEVSELFLIVSLVAIGINTNMKEILEVGLTPLIVISMTTFAMAGIAIATIYMI